MKNLHGRAALILAQPDFDVDEIVGVENIKISDTERLKEFVLRWCPEEFGRQMRPGDFIVAGPNFGYGHPHYQTMIAMRHLGISGVIAEYFSPGYWLGEISQGFPQIPCPRILEKVKLWDELEVDWASGLVRNLTQRVDLPFNRLAQSEMATLEAGGMLAYLGNQRGQRCA